ncbi:hypothetical protein EVAR_39264_1 [Eumeta japonica]|uniref:Uncharacterized protein n=1 Tax=Eumeta variegata TaxID=151549 RepID=A0A4C1VVL5_EUMVA|nr:hypothetical protein EVAR_39264_1 [Eumeta japonica]
MQRYWDRCQWKQRSYACVRRLASTSNKNVGIVNSSADGDNARAPEGAEHGAGPYDSIYDYPAPALALGTL